jgi:hypothetical protein
MNIFKTFEIFLREPLSIIKRSLIQIVNINSNLASPSGVNVDLLEGKAQITVVNSDKMYNLLKTVQKKREDKAAQMLLEATPPRQMVLGQLCKRQ